jgi:hypothetical protein
MEPEKPLIGVAAVLVIVLYAQLTLFIGIFTQLLFDPAPVTAPIANP